MIPVGRNAWDFPEPTEWPDDDVICVGADLEPSTLIDAYSRGLFPMYVDKKQKLLGWWSPIERGIIPMDGLRITRSLRQSISKYRCTIDEAFTDVMKHCGTVNRKGGWITDDFVHAYSTLFDLGWAHSVETWDDSGRLVGGLYGVRIGGFFAGESMFHSSRDASKVALVFLVDSMRAAGMELLDTQWCTEHLASMGGISVSRNDYLDLLNKAINKGILTA